MHGALCIVHGIVHFPAHFGHTKRSVVHWSKSDFIEQVHFPDENKLGNYLLNFYFIRGYCGTNTSKGIFSPYYMLKNVETTESSLKEGSNKVINDCFS